MRVPKLKAPEWLAWGVPVGVMAGIVLWGYLIFAVVGDKPRDWQYGGPTFIPSESWASSERPAGAAPAKQMELPPVVPGGAR